MVTPFDGPSPGDESDDGWRLDQLRWFWQQLYAGDDPGETTWEELAVLHRQVTSALSSSPPDVTRAETLTAYVMALMTGMMKDL